MQLRAGTLLKGGDYRIECVLGQGGFGITYLATDVGLARKVAIKEFFMKEHCNRDADNTSVSVPSVGSREMVDKFRDKFLKEARLIAALEHPNIIPIYSVFEENGTAYYVMKYIAGGSLNDALRHGRLPESEAVRYVRDVAAALRYCHAPERMILHLDVKPNNVLLCDGRAVLIDFGVSKHYDRAGKQTSSKPVGTSCGYAPPELYNDSADSLRKFSAATDVYSLGATLYKLVTGDTPPHAMDVSDDGLPPLPASVSSVVCRAIECAMQPRRKDRPQSIDAFLDLLGEGNVVSDNDPDATYVKLDENEEVEDRVVSSSSEIKLPNFNMKWLWGVLAVLFVALVAFGIHRCGSTVGGGVADSDTVSLMEEGMDTMAVNNKEGDENVNPTESVVNQNKEEQEDAEKQRLEEEKRKAEEEKQRLAEEQRKAKEASALTGTINGHDYVDLGLSVRWATCNVGASSPSGYGNYYAWGETSTKNNYSWGTYKWCSGSYDSQTRYCTNSSYGTVDGKSRLDMADDAARVNWGSPWRMPTKAEMEELKNRCTWIWTTLNGVKGYNVKGPSGKCIFLPAAGFRLASGLGDAGSYGYYWTASLREGYPNDAWYLRFDSGGWFMGSSGRGHGRSVRAVLCEN